MIIPNRAGATLVNPTPQPAGGDYLLGDYDGGNRTFLDDAAPQPWDFGVSVPAGANVGVWKRQLRAYVGNAEVNADGATHRVRFYLAGVLVATVDSNADVATVGLVGPWFDNAAGGAATMDRQRFGGGTQTAKTLDLRFNYQWVHL
jgi:hypothetical protein